LESHHRHRFERPFLADNPWPDARRNLTALLVWLSVLSLPDYGKLHVTWLDVSGSDAASIETPDGKTNPIKD
jgi:hypothetical protein